MKVHDVDIEEVRGDTGNELAEKFYRCCGFCDKLVKINGSNLKSCVNLSGRGFFCPFCLRHNFHHKSNRHVLVLSYRAIIAHYYYRNYILAHKKMWMNEIKCCIKSHQFVGLQNPVFSYDPITYLWFVDFTKVGDGCHKAPLSEVLGTAQAMLHTFELQKHYSQHTFYAMWEKYNKAIELFYTQRKRPKGRRMLIPTLSNCIAGDWSHFDKTRDFLSFQLELK